MAKKCPPGVLCIENFTLFLLLIVCAGIVYFMSNHLLTQNIMIDRINRTTKKILHHPTPTPTTTILDKTTGSMLLDPTVPPLKKVNYVDTRNEINPRRGVPINIRTRGDHLGHYNQIGFLKGKERKDLIYPLYGRPNDTSRDKWNYYTLNDTGIKLPISKQSKSCTGEYGCNELMNGEDVYVEGVDAIFIATIYENESNRYIPYI